MNWSCFNIRVLDNMATLLRTTPANTLWCRHQGIGTHRHYHHKAHPYTSHSWWTSPKQHPRVCLISHVLGRSLTGDPHSSGSLSLGGLCYTRAPGWPLILKRVRVASATQESRCGLCNTREPVWPLQHKRAGVASATQESRCGLRQTREQVGLCNTREPWWLLLHKRARVATATQESRGGHCYTREPGWPLLHKRAGVASDTQENRGGP